MKRTKQEIYALLDEYKKASCTVKSFCEQKGIAQWQYYYWKRQRGRAGKEQGKERSGFVEININQSSEYCAVRVQLRSGIEIVCQGDNISKVAQLLKELDNQYA
ncbi:MAG TPA: hypothetical protein ENJ51_11205 [Leucothrix mucor]|uniref:Transposase n=1 Tax=Leucothrix mucor TaxID=45248 RepID=A0A7V2WVZ2_LEUMU|nr:hypothetical protein [Leucothrix mucor]